MIRESVEIRLEEVAKTGARFVLKCLLVASFEFDQTIRG